MAKHKAKCEGIQPDTKNANKGTERGRYMVEASLRETGAGRSIVLDKDGRKCRAVEISAGYCAVALQRWVDHTGKTPILLST